MRDASAINPARRPIELSSCDIRLSEQVKVPSYRFCKASTKEWKESGFALPPGARAD